MNRKIEDGIPELESLVLAWDVSITCETSGYGNRFAVRLTPPGSNPDAPGTEVHVFRAATVRAAVLLAFGG